MNATIKRRIALPLLPTPIQTFHTLRGNNFHFRSIASISASNARAHSLKLWLPQLSARAIWASGKASRNRTAFWRNGGDVLTTRSGARHVRGIRPLPLDTWTQSSRPCRVECRAGRQPTNSFHRGWGGFLKKMGRKKKRKKKTIIAYKLLQELLEMLLAHFSAGEDFAGGKI